VFRRKNKAFKMRPFRRAVRETIAEFKLLREEPMTADEALEFLTARLPSQLGKVFRAPLRVPDEDEMRRLHEAMRKADERGLKPSDALREVQDPLASGKKYSELGRRAAEILVAGGPNTEEEELALARLLGGETLPWRKSEQRCPECSKYFFEARRSDSAINPAPYNLPGAVVQEVDTRSGSVKHLRIGVGEHGIPVDLNSRRFLRELRLFVCTECWFRGYAVERLNPQYPEAGRYAESWQRM
jgi:hypothetical protein